MIEYKLIYWLITVFVLFLIFHLLKLKLRSIDNFLFSKILLSLFNKMAGEATEYGYGYNRSWVWIIFLIFLIIIIAACVWGFRRNNKDDCDCKKNKKHHKGGKKSKDSYSSDSYDHSRY